MAGPGSAGENAVRKDGKLMVSKGLMVQNPSGHFEKFLLKFVGNRVMRQREDEAAQRIMLAAQSQLAPSGILSWLEEAICLWRVIGKSF